MLHAVAVGRLIAGMSTGRKRVCGGVTTVQCTTLLGGQPTAAVSAGMRTRCKPRRHPCKAWRFEKVAILFCGHSLTYTGGSYEASNKEGCCPTKHTRISMPPYSARASVYFSLQALRRFAFQQHVTVAPPVQAPVLQDLHVCFAVGGVGFVRFRHYGGHFHDHRVGRLLVGQLLQPLVGPRR